MKNYLIISLLFVTLTSCKQKSEWIFTKIFDFETSTLDQKITEILLIDENTGFLLGDESEKIKENGGTERDQSAIFFRSTDGGKTLEKQILGKGKLEDLSQSTDKKSYYMIRSQFSDNNETTQPNRKQLLRSTNLGKTWDELYVFEDKVILKILFYDNLIGFVSTYHDPAGTDLKKLYKTTDGGKTWSLTAVDIEDLRMDRITTDRKIVGRYMDDNLLAIWRMDIDDFSIKRIDLNAPENLRIYGRLKADPVTGFHYIQLRTQFDDSEYYIYCIETKEVIELPKHSYTFSVYGDFVATISNDRGTMFREKYHYSYNKGKKWHSEAPGSPILFGPRAMYGKGYLWVPIVGREGEQYPLMVRVPKAEN